MMVDTLLFIGLLVVIFLLVYILISQRETSFLNKNESASQIQKIDTLAQDINKINEGLLSVTTPLGELNRFLGGNVTTGRLGEWSLESIVRDIMPDGSYHFQHIINPETSDQVDCAVITADGIKVPIDSKLYVGQYNNYQSASTDRDRKTVSAFFFEELAESATRAALPWLGATATRSNMAFGRRWSALLIA